MKKMVLKNSAPMQWKGNQQKTAKEFIVKKSQQWAMRAEVGAEASKHRGRGEQSQQPMTTLEDKGRHTNGHNTPGCTESRGQEIVETMPLPTKLKAKWEVKLWEEEVDERTEDTIGGADQIEENKKEDFPVR